MENAFLPLADTLFGQGTLTSPTAHAGIASTAVPPAGRYHIKIRYILTGTAETALSNIELNINGSNATSGFPSLSGSGWAELNFFITLNGTNIVRVANTAAATTGAVYSASIMATRLGP